MALKENSLLALIRVRGTVGVKHDIAETLKRLKLEHVNNLSLVLATKPAIGMIKKSSDYITFGEISADMLAKLLEKKGLNVDKQSVELVLKGEKKPEELGIKLPLRMHPPRRGYESIKRPYGHGGALGYRGNDIDKLISRML
ncbi:MAG: uL30 family ribosomal protein [Candidatus Micrarchaeia archaeon]